MKFDQEQHIDDCMKSDRGSQDETMRASPQMPNQHTPARRRWLRAAGLTMLIGTALMAGCSCVSASPTSMLNAGVSAPPFEVADTSGHRWSLDQLKGKIVVIEWTSTSCPFAAAQYRSKRIPELQKWAADHGVEWMTVLSTSPGRSSYLPPDQALAFNQQRGGRPSALLLDSSGAMLKAYGAKTANHFFIVDKAGKIAYVGGVDDSQSMNVSEILKSRGFVRDALEDLTNGRPVRTPQTEPFGCVIASE